MGASSRPGLGALGLPPAPGAAALRLPASLLHGHWSECAGNWSVFLRCFCSGGTLVFMVELCGRQSHFPLSCYDILYHCAFYFTLFCLFASIIFHYQLCSVSCTQSHTRNRSLPPLPSPASVLCPMPPQGGLDLRPGWRHTLLCACWSGRAWEPVGLPVLVILALIFSTIINCRSGFQYTSATVRQTILCSVCFSLGMMSTLVVPLTEWGR